MGPSGSPSASPAFTPGQIAKIDSAAEATLDDQISGVVVSVSDPERGTILKAYGDAQRGGSPMTPDVHYRVASVTKTFTAHAVLQLVDQGELSLQDPIEEYVPGLPNGERITIRDLLGMRGGVYDYVNDPAFIDQYAKDPLWPGWKVEDAVDIMKAHADEFRTPDTKTVYSNSEYVLLGLVVEKVTGQPVDTYINNTAGDLGLKETTFPTTRTSLPSPYANGYWYYPPKGTPPKPSCTTDTPSPGATGASLPRCGRDVTRSNPLVPWTAGAVVSTVPDMTEYAAQLATGVGLKPRTAKLRQDWTSLSNEGIRLQYGLGVMRVGDWVGHDGAIFGYSDMVFYLPSKKATVVVMTNASDAEAVTSTPLWGEIVKELYPGSLPTAG
ncbi:serine hydrolase domain-containing protein [Streptomyces sp. NPDC058867]